MRSGPRQLLPGTRRHRYRCSLPGLAEFTADRRGEADADRRRLSPLRLHDSTTEVRIDVLAGGNVIIFGLVGSSVQSGTVLRGLSV
jgi:hypothetical protein